MSRISGPKVECQNCQISTSSYRRPRGTPDCDTTTLGTNPSVEVSVGTPRPRGTRRGGPLVPILETHRLIILETLLVRKIARAREIARTRGGFLQWTNVGYCTDRVTPLKLDATRARASPDSSWCACRTSHGGVWSECCYECCAKAAASDASERDQTVQALTRACLGEKPNKKA